MSHDTSAGADGIELSLSKDYCNPRLSQSERNLRDGH